MRAFIRTASALAVGLLLTLAALAVVWLAVSGYAVTSGNVALFWAAMGTGGAAGVIAAPVSTYFNLTE